MRTAAPLKATTPAWVTAPVSGEHYHRYALTANGVSPMTIPGTPGQQYPADGLEHNPDGPPSRRAADHQAQLDKRRDKLLRHDYGAIWAEIEGEGEIAVLTWGSTAGSVREAAARAQGLAVKAITLRLLVPVQPVRLTALLAGAQRVLVVEQSHSQQFLGYLRAHYSLPADIRILNQPGPLPIRPAAVLAQLSQWKCAGLEQ